VWSHQHGKGAGRSSLDLKPGRTSPSQPRRGMAPLVCSCPHAALAITRAGQLRHRAPAPPVRHLVAYWHNLYGSLQVQCGVAKRGPECLSLWLSGIDQISQRLASATGTGTGDLAMAWASQRGTASVPDAGSRRIPWRCGAGTPSRRLRRPCDREGWAARRAREGGRGLCPCVAVSCTRLSCPLPARNLPRQSPRTRRG
jgi:hypothetical protein